VNIQVGSSGSRPVALPMLKANIFTITASMYQKKKKKKKKKKN
jgi:hypothetical protein